MNAQRWTMSRAGVLNFWFYDDVAFELSEGRLIFRGPNGSGKSVTMQSFLPLVLDGDKRPHRLDPFGSRDRKVEFYLLGEAESGHQDRIGYLYLEFTQPHTGKFLTVGIGLHATRGKQAVGFWGFVVTDGRRIGRDLLLYDQDAFETHGQKVPLDRPGLEAAIGDGGKVVREQGEYSRLVNQHLFGFDDPEAYKELLNLLIQLRSPKLSKNFRPTEVYTILNAALPPLAEEELRPLSDVLADLDEIGDRLEELRAHRVETERLQSAYGQYNQFRLYSTATDVQGAQQRAQQQQAEHTQARGHRDEQAAKYESVQAARADAQQQSKEAALQIDAIEKSEEMEKRQELDFLQDRLKDTQETARISSARLQTAQAEETRKGQQLDKLAGEQVALALESGQIRADMTGLAQAMEFADHALYEATWAAQDAQRADGGGQALGDGADTQLPVAAAAAGAAQPGAASWAALERDARQYRDKLKEAQSLGAAVRDQAQRKADAEAAMSQAREARDARESAQQQAEQQMSEAVTAQEDALLIWRKQLEELTVPDEAWHEATRRLQRYPEAPYSAVLEPIRQAGETARSDLQREKLQLEHDRSGQQSALADLQAELATWQRQREPEPPRSEATERSRARRRAAAGDSAAGTDTGEGGIDHIGGIGEKRAAVGAGVPGGGAPLYAVCEFRKDVDDRTRGALETALQRAGLVDAFVTPDGWQLADGEEDSYIAANPVWFVPTLADFLEPLPPADSGLTAEQVENVLRTIVMGDPDDAAAATVTPDGRYRIGPLSGQVEPKPRAEWIGAQARRQTRLAQIARLEQAIAVVYAEIAQLEQALGVLRDRLAMLADELAALPDEQCLRQAADALHRAQLDLDHAVAEELRASDRFKTAQRVWREAQQAFHNFVAAWQQLRTEADFGAAQETMVNYLGQVAELKSKRTVAEAKAAEMARLCEELTAWQDQAAAERVNLHDVQLRADDLQTQVSALQKVLQDLGVYDLYQRLDDLKAQRATWENTARRLVDEEKQTYGDLNRADERMAQRQAQLESAQAALAAALNQLRGEWWLKLVEAGEDTDLAQVAARLEAPDTVVIGGDTRAALQSSGVADSALESASGRHRDNLLALARLLVRKFRARYEQRREEQIRDGLSETFALAKNVLIEYGLESRYDDRAQRVFIESRRVGRALTPAQLTAELRQMEEQQSALIDEKDRELYEQILLHSVGRAIRDRINRAEQWVAQMNRFMAARKTSSGLVLSLAWAPKAAQNERELDTDKLLTLLRKSTDALRADEIEEMMSHFRSRINWAKQEAEDGGTLRQAIGELLDYRGWFSFTLYYRKGDSPRRELTDSRFNVMSGGEKAMAMYIPLFAAADSRYKDSNPTAPRIVSLDEAFAGVDEDNLKDMFELMTDMEFDYMMTSQVLWGCYETVPALSIYEVHRPNDGNFVTLIPYYWNGTRRTMVGDGQWDSVREAAAAATAGTAASSQGAGTAGAGISSQEAEQTTSTQEVEP